jgi:beta-alanine degradation protein BauB
MKHLSYVLSLLLVSGVALAADKAKSQAAKPATSPAATMATANPMDPLVVAPTMYKQLLDNPRVRVMEVTFQPGEKIGRHSHPDHYVYVVSAGKLRISKPDGSSVDADLQAGQVMWIPAETHWAENTGTTVVKLVVNELK